MKKLVYLIFLCAFTAVSYGQFFKTSGKQIVDARGNNVLLRGFGLGGWMLQEGYMLGIQREGQQYRIRQRIEELIGKENSNLFYDSWLNNHTTRGDIDSMKVWGFNSIRLPMHYNLYTLPVEQEPDSSQQTWLFKGFERTDSLLEWCKANGLYLILDLHAAPGGQGNDNNISDRDPSKPSLWESEAARKKTIALWRKLAERYVNDTTIIAYDILNEPNWGFADPINDKNGLAEKGNQPLETLMRQITTAIREVDKNHIIIIEGNGWGNNYNGMLDDGVWDNNMVLSYHKYWNFNDENSIAHILAARDKYNVPVWLGETGENSNTWFTQAIQLLEAHNIGWAWWPLKKIGFNNPLQVKTTADYHKIVDYWNGKTKIPLQVDFNKTLMDFAKSTHHSKNIFHKDVVDAMMRQPHNYATLPYAGHKVGKQYLLPAVEYDLGRNNYAYYDLDTANYRVSNKPGVGNKGATYRNDGVDIYKDEEGSFYVGSFVEDEWLQYTIHAEEPGTYEITIKAIADTINTRISILNQQTGKAYQQAIPQAADDKSWPTVVIKNVMLKKGENRLKIDCWVGKMRLKDIRFARQEN